MRISMAHSQDLDRFVDRESGRVEDVQICGCASPIQGSSARVIGFHVVGAIGKGGGGKAGGIVSQLGEGRARRLVADQFR